MLRIPEGVHDVGGRERRELRAGVDVQAAEGLRQLQRQGAGHDVDRVLVDAIREVGAFVLVVVDLLGAVARRPVGVLPAHPAGADVQTVGQVLDLIVVGEEAADLEVVALQVAGPVGLAPRGVTGTVEVALGLVAIVHRVHHWVLSPRCKPLVAKMPCPARPERG